MDTIEQAQSPQSIAVSEPDWNAIKSKYLAGETPTDLAEEFGTLPSTICMRAKREKWRALLSKELLADLKATSEDVRGSLIVNIWKESKFFAAREPSNNAEEMELWARVRDRLIIASTKLLNWDADPVAASKPAKCIDV